jgi:sarcosine oxidase
VAETVRRTSFLVVGAGLAGACAAWRLAQRGHEVTLLDRDRPASPGGSSHGSARILRFAYPERELAALVVRALDGWSELEAAAGSPLLTRAPALDHGPGRDPRALARVLEDVGVEHELLSAAEAGDRWPQVAADGEVLHQPGGAVLDAERTVHAAVGQARAHGAQLLTGWPLASLERSGHGVQARFTARAEDGRAVEAARVVVAVGGWLPDVLGRLALPPRFLAGMPRVVVTEETAVHLPYAEEHAHDAWPTVIHQRSGELPVYALPGGRDADHRGLKVAQHAAGRQVASAARRSGVVDGAAVARVVAHARRHLPGVVPEPYAETTCLYTSTPTEDFVIDGADGVTVVSACSGHGGKFAPLLGVRAADAATGDAPVPERFRVR